MYTIGNQINEATLLHITKDKKKAKEISMEVMRKVGIANVEKRYNQYPHEFSGGMLQRALIAMALVCNPKLLIADEPTTALDVTIQAQILELMKELQKDFNTAILFITHDLGVVAKMCDRVAVMYLGKIVESADAKEIYANPQHPYTRGLIGSVHKIGSKKEDRLFSIEGTVPLAMNLPDACGFYDRCDVRIEGLCNKADPDYKPEEPKDEPTDEPTEEPDPELSLFNELKNAVDDIFAPVQGYIPGCSGVVGGIAGGVSALGIALVTLLRKKENKDE
jgi:peptide/nickel transport system ATP-binding protein